MNLKILRRLRPILGGVKQFACGYSSVGETVGGNAKPRYCYSVWLRHLIAWRRAGMTGPIQAVAELGPGDSLGTGVAALLSGVDRYYALDIVAYSKSSSELVEPIAELFRRGADIPGDDEFPELKPKLDSYKFPRDILPNDTLKSSLLPQRIQSVRRAFERLGTQHGKVVARYYAPWYDSSVMERGMLDAVFSQAVMEHVNDIEATYRALSSWLRETGYMSHQIDFRSHGLASEWYGHWSYSDWVFRLARGRRPYLLNREPKSAHLKAIRDAGFEILDHLRVEENHGIDRKQLARRFRRMTDRDLTTSGLFVVARRPLCATNRIHPS